MNIFRIFFVSTVFIPVLVVVVTTSEESGIRIRKPRNIVISEDGTRTERRYNPVNISDKNCPALGCTGNLTWNENNGKRSVASVSTLPASERDGTSSNLSAKKARRVSSWPKCSGNSSIATGKCKGEEFIVRTSSYNQDEQLEASRPFHTGPLKLEIKSIRNSTRTDGAPVDFSSLMAEEESGRSLITAAVLITWIAVWKWKAYISFFIVHTIDFIWTSVKNLLGWGNEHYETTITWGHEHPPWKGHRNGLFHPHHNHHGHKQPHGWGNPHQKKWVYKTKNPWHHPASKVFEQPTYQYLPHGKEYTMLGYDQHQAYKWRRKYGKKFAHYRRKYYRKKHRQVLKAQRRRERERHKAERRKQKAERRKEKWERFKDRVKDVQAFYNKIKIANQKANGEYGDDDDDEANDDLKEAGQKVTGAIKIESSKYEINKKNKNKGDDGNKKQAGIEKQDLIKNDDIGDDDLEEKDEEEPEDDLEYDKHWEESSSEMEHGPAPSTHYHSASYHPEKDYDPLPVKSKHQKYIRIRLR